MATPPPFLPSAHSFSLPHGSESATLVQMARILLYCSRGQRILLSLSWSKWWPSYSVDFVDVRWSRIVYKSSASNPVVGHEIFVRNDAEKFVKKPNLLRVTSLQPSNMPTIRDHMMQRNGIGKWKILKMTNKGWVWACNRTLGEKVLYSERIMWIEFRWRFMVSTNIPGLHIILELLGFSS